MALERDFIAPFRRAVREEMHAAEVRPLPPLTGVDLEPLPPPVQRYIRASGAIGRPPPQNMRVLFDVRFRMRPGMEPLRARSLQYNVFATPARMFFMSARWRGVPLQGLHTYRGTAATFQIRAAGLVNVVDQSGPVLSAAETVTVLNDMCLMAPASLLDERLAWEPIDDRSVSVCFTNGPHRVQATLLFDDEDRLVDFWSDDRPDTSTGEPVQTRWRTPLSRYRRVSGLRLGTLGSAVYERADGPFEYGEFDLQALAYDVGPPAPPA